MNWAMAADGIRAFVDVTTAAASFQQKTSQDTGGGFRGTPKSEARNPSEIRNPKPEMCHRLPYFSDLGLGTSFGFRASDFGFLNSRPSITLGAVIVVGEIK